jgi:hypothetical protein
MEFEGKGLSTLTDRMDMITRDISNFAVNLVINDQINNKTATQSIIDQNNNTSSLINCVRDLSATLTLSVNEMLEWNAFDNNYIISLNTDFVSSRISAQDMRELTNMLLSGTISYDTYWAALQNGEVVSEDVTSSEEKDKINNEFITS